MKTIKQAAVLCSSVLFVTSAFAGSNLENTKIIQVAMNRSIGEFIFIRVASTPTGIPGCSNHGFWHYTLPVASAGDKAIYASLVAAMISGATVNVSGYGSCTEFASVETLQGFGVEM